MSHFTVAVFTDGTKSVDELLAPYDEELVVAPYIGRTKEEMIASAKATKEDLLKRERVDDWMKPYLAANTDEEFYQCEVWEDSKYDEFGNELSTYNPNSKWDWYQEGGRWSGLLRLKDGSRVDSARVSEIDFSQNKKAYKSAIRWWEVVVENIPLRDGEKREDFFNLYRIEYLKERYQNKERYATEMSEFSTFAVVTPDGKWHEEGSMGWWACVNNENTEWNQTFKENFIDTASPEWQLTIVDCHI